MAVATSSQNTLRKLGSHLRWMIEKEGIDAEKVRVAICVNDETEKSLMISAFLREFEKQTMTRNDLTPNCVVVHGVPIWIVIKAKE